MTFFRMELGREQRSLLVGGHETAASIIAPGDALGLIGKGQPQRMQVGGRDGHGRIGMDEIAVGVRVQDVPFSPGTMSHCSHIWDNGDDTGEELPGVSGHAGRLRKPEIVADAAHAILVRDPRGCTGNFFLDEDVLREAGVTDFARYAVEPGQPLMPDLFLD